MVAVNTVDICAVGAGRVLAEAIQRPWGRYLLQFQTVTESQESPLSIVPWDFGRIAIKLGGSFGRKIVIIISS